ncbi:porin, partial [Camelimonas abortus]
TESWSVAAAFLHYWTPQLRSGVSASYGQVRFPAAARITGPLGNLNTGAGVYNAAFRDYSQFVGSGNLIWSPVKDLDIGVEVLYERIDIRKGRVWDQNRGGAATGKTVTYDDNWLTRLRIDRTF